MKKKIIYGLLFAVAMVTASSSFVSCKDYEGDDYAKLQEQNLTLKDALQKQIDGMSAYALKTDLKDWALKSDLNDYALKTALNDYLLKTDYKAIEDTAELHKWVDAICQSVKALEKDSISKYAELIHQNNILITHIGDTLHQFVYAWGDNLEETLENAGKAKEIALSYDADTTKIMELIHKADSVAWLAWDFVRTAHPDKVLAGNTFQPTGENGTFANLQELVSYFEEADLYLQAEIDTLKERVQKLEDSFKKQVTGIIVQGTYSPVFGNGSLPLGIQTNILAAYAGKSVVTDGQFPTTDNLLYIARNGEQKAVLTENDMDFAKKLGASWETVTFENGDLLISSADDNAGTLYLTVNPTNIDFDGTQFTLVNSQGAETKVELSPLKPSEEVLTFGWTRTAIEAASKNGFYEVKAKITEENALAMQPKIAKDQFKEAVKLATDGKKRMAVKEVARALFNSLQPVQRFGIQAKWYDDVKDDMVRYTSAYDIAAFTLDPLGFNFKLPAGKYTRVPTINKHLIAEELHIDDINVEMPVITVENKANGDYLVFVEVPELKLDNDLYVEEAGGTKYNGYTIYRGSDAGHTGTYSLYSGYEFREGYAYIDMTMLFETMYGDMNAAFTDLNKVTGQVNEKIDKIINTVNNYVDRANNWINRANNLLDRLGDAVQPVLLWSNGENCAELGGFVSGNYVAGTIVKAGSELGLIPTSYSLELFAPAYKKSLLVTNAYKDGKSAQQIGGELEAAAEAVAKQLKDYALFEGNSIKPIIINIPEYKGVTVEIAYTAVDYEGKVAGRKFYFTIQ